MSPDTDVDADVGCAGQYTCKEGRNSPCLVYVSFNHKIYIYWKVELERMESTNLLRLLEDKPEFRRLVKELGVGRRTHNTGGGGSVMVSFISFTRTSALLVALIGQVSSRD